MGWHKKWWIQIKDRPSGQSHYQMVPYILESSLMVWRMVTVSRSGRMDPNTTVSGRETKPTGTALWSMPMATFMKVNGIMIRHTGMERTSMPTEQPMSEIGLRISSMARELRNGPTVPNTRVITRMVRRMATDAWHLQMEVTTLANSKTMKSQASVNTSGPTVRCMRDNGKRTKCTARVPLSGVMVSNTRATS